MRRLVLISSYCDTEEKIKVLKENLIKYKELGLDTLLISPLHLESKITELCDYYFNTKENPILCYPERILSYWGIYDFDENLKIKLIRGYCEYGWAALLQTKRLLQLGIMLDYDILIHTVYDLEIDDYVLNELKTESEDTIFKWIDPVYNEEHNASLHFIILTKKTAIEFEKSIEKEVFMKINGYAETLVDQIKEKLKIKNSQKPIKDSIYYHNGNEHHNFSKDGKYKLFFTKKNYENVNFEIYIYGLSQDCDIQILVNEKKWEHFSRENKLITSDILCENIEKIKIICEGVEKDYMEEFYKIEWSLIEKL